MRDSIKKLIPHSLLGFLRVLIERKNQRKIQKLSYDLSSLADINQIDLKNIFWNKEYQELWAKIQRDIDLLQLSNTVGGVNAGDRKAISYLVTHLNPKSVLEVGTHIGASTAHIAATLKNIRLENNEDEPLRFVSVDILDVNDPIEKPWIKHGSTFSPLEMIKKIECDNFTEFIADKVMNFFTHCDEKFDFIFLDGDHSTKAVYEEVLTAMNFLNDGGYILLHDYYPDMQPLWPNGALIPGPCLAIQRLEKEGVGIKVLPLGELPWPTKSDSNLTSLALLGKNGSV